MERIKRTTIMTYSEEDLLALAIKLIYEWNDHALPSKVIEEEARKAVEEFKKENELIESFIKHGRNL